jgi:hypothetical protein
VATPALRAGEALGAEAYRVRRSPTFAATKQQRLGAEHSWGEAPPDFSTDAPAQEAELREAGGVELAAPPPDMSPFLIGSVAVGLIIVEGPDQNLQFSEAERIKVTAEVQDGLSWLALQEPLARITWTYDVHIVRVDVPPNPSLPNTFEAKEAHWRNPALASLGFSPDFQGVVDYVASLRLSMGTDHAFVAFFTKYELRGVLAQPGAVPDGAQRSRAVSIHPRAPRLARLERRRRARSARRQVTHSRRPCCRLAASCCIVGDDSTITVTDSADEDHRPMAAPAGRHRMNCHAECAAPGAIR